MSAFAVSPPVRAHPRMRRIWLPLVLSLAIHVLVGMGAVLASRSGISLDEAPPVPVDVVTVESGCDTVLPDPAPRGPSRLTPSGGDDAPFLAHVDEGPALPPVSLPGGLEPSSVAGDPASSGVDGGSVGAGGGGSGILTAPGTARRVVYVIDCSVSMGTSGALAIAKRELLAALAALPTDARFAVILYNHQAEPLRLEGAADFVAATPDNHSAVARYLEQLRAEGSTNHLAALRRALMLGPEVIFFVTDADDLKKDQVRNVMLFNHGGAAIHAVELSNKGPTPEESALQLLARLSGGTHRLVPLK